MGKIKVKISRLVFSAFTGDKEKSIGCDADHGQRNLLRSINYFGGEDLKEAKGLMT